MTELLHDALGLWHDCPTTLPPFRRTFHVRDQAAREEAFDGFLACIGEQLEYLPQTRSERERVRDRIAAGFVSFGKAALDLDDSHFSLLLDGGFSDIGTALAHRARRFDPRVSTADILQASRNAWTACGLEVLLRREMYLNPAIFAYSMLYPYTDNYLDDPAASREEKAAFNARFGRRLAGTGVAAANDREQAIWALIGIIEEEYGRSEWPQVFDSLLAIHRAQENSMRLLRSGRSTRPDVLALSFEKGGASVLADAYLAAGSVSENEARFAFSWGVLLQLADDLQDLRQDLEDGVLTLFSESAGERPLDELTNRTVHFAQRVMSLIDGMPGSDCRPLRDLIERSSASLLIRAAGDAGEYYTPEYIAELETHSPFRFAFLADRRKRWERHSGRLGRLFEAFLEGDEDEPAFPLLPSSLMPRFD